MSLQKHDGVEQLADAPACLDPVRLGDRIDGETGAFMDTAAILKNLDLLVTADTAVAHVAGALGVPVWLALSFVPDWRWLLDRDDTPWYPTMRLFRQTAPGDWAGVFQEIAAALQEQEQHIRPKRPADYRVATRGANRVTRARHGLVVYNRHDIYIGRSLDCYGEFSEGECGLFRQMIRPGGTVVEAGAHCGAHTLVLSRQVGPNGTVHAFEPQRPLFEALCATVAVNGRTNVRCHRAAAGAAPGELFVPPLDYSAENNFGGLGLGDYETGEPVPVTTIDSLELSRCDFLKADVEGMELDVLKGATATIGKHRPVLYVENDRADSSAALIEHIMSLGYELYWHLPPLYNPRNYFGNPENVFERVVSINMLCVHKDVKSSIKGLRRIASPDDDWRGG